jgi:hypothetical protein
MSRRGRCLGRSAASSAASAEKATVQHLLETARLVTLTGTGGIGKTRLALEVAADSDVVAFVDLAPVSDGELVGVAVAEAVGIRKQPNVPLETLLTRWVSSRSLLPLVRVTGPRWSEARYLDALALLAIEQGDFDEAARWLTSSLDVARAMGDAWSEAAALNKLGDVARAQSDYARAGRLYEESLLRLEGQGDELRASVVHNLGYVAIAEGDQARATALLRQSLKLCQARGEQRGMAECLVGFACLAAATGQHERAARLFGAADAAFESLGSELSPSNRLDQRRGLDLARDGNEAAFASAYAAGQALSFDGAVRDAFANGASCEPPR